jgi:hypothetical protein
MQKQQDEGEKQRRNQLSIMQNTSVGFLLPSDQQTKVSSFTMFLYAYLQYRRCIYIYDRCLSPTDGCSCNVAISLGEVASGIDGVDTA